MKKSDNLKLDYHHIVRGTILSLTVELENIIDIIISGYFCQPKKIDFFKHMVLPSDKISLENKRQVLEKIFMASYSDKEYKERFHTTMKNIERRIIPKRNEYAHGKIFLNEEGAEVGIGFKRYKDGKEKVYWYPSEEVQELLELIKHSVEVLGQFEFK